MTSYFSLAIWDLGSNYHIAGNFYQEKQFRHPLSLANFSCANDEYGDLYCIGENKYLFNTKVAGFGETHELFWLYTVYSL